MVDINGNDEVRWKGANKLIDETVEEVMLNVFGKRTFERILRIMREKYSLKINKISEKPQVFSKALRRIVGDNSIIIEDLIVESLYLKIGLKSRWKRNYSFSDYITEIRKLIEMRDSIQY
ncbi:hypothetical protein KEJ34_08770 [Candidatus Bathyarchaeota archaeon]|nr:hypothetical protein [Candidatus Bathyarchaeota archaeon]